MSAGESGIDSVLFIGFGGPTQPDEILPFLRNVTAGRNIPDERLRDVERHYHEVGGRSPYNELTERQRAATEQRLAEGGRPLPVYLGMRNWDPLLPEVVRRMKSDGRRGAVGVILSPHRSEAGWDRYREDLERALDESPGSDLSVQLLEPWYDHPRYLEANACRIEEAVPYRRGAWPETVPVIFTAHSIPTRMAEASPYVEDVRRSCAGVAEILGVPDWEIAYQSRTGNPRTPWLEPDINDALRRRAGAGAREVVVQSIGFLCDHVEVLFDLDVEARGTCREVGVEMHRAPCVNDHPEFIAMLGEKILETAGAAG